MSSTKWHIIYKIQIIFITFILLVLLISIPVAAAGTETMISTDYQDRNNFYPGIGLPWIVWQEQGTDTVIAYNYVTGVEQAFPKHLRSQLQPSASRQMAVWYETDDGITSELYYSDLGTNPNLTYSVPAPAASLKKHPVISGGNIAWEEWTGGHSDIYLYNISTNLIYDLTPGTDIVDETFPAISGNRIVWVENNPGESDIYTNDTVSWTSVAITDSDGFSQDSPAISGDNIVWVDDSNAPGDTDVILYNFDTHTLTPLTNADGFTQLTPAISGNYVIWKDDHVFIPFLFDVVLCDITSMPLTTEEITTDSYVYPDVDSYIGVNEDNRIVWVDTETGVYNIDMFSNGVTGITCPVAQFTEDITTGAPPLTVTFDDLSTDSPTHWRWDFGDRTFSSIQDPVHSFSAAGTFPVSLTAGTQYCRNTTTGSGVHLISAGVPPTALFTMNVTTGMVPLAVQFTNTSAGWQTGHDWNFGDGSPNSTVANPLHTYITGGTYTVLLFATNDYGTATERKTAIIHALSGGTMTQSTDIAGITIVPDSGNQHLDFDTLTLTDYIFNPANNSVLTCVPPVGSGIAQITFYSLDGTGFTQTGSTISGTVSRTNIMSAVLPLAGFSNPSLGTLSSMNYTFDYSGYPAIASITANVYDDSSFDRGNLLNTVNYNSFTAANGIPYVIQFVKTNITASHQADIRMSVDSAWATANGWRTDHVYTMRVTEGNYGEILPAIYLMHDPVNNVDFYHTTSIHGLSKFAFSDLSGSGNVFQMAYLGVQEHFGGNEPSDSDTGSGQGTGMTSQQNQQPLNQPQLNPPAPTAVSADLYINNLGIITQTTVLESVDQLATIEVGRGVTALDGNGNPLSSISIEPLSSADVAVLPSSGTLTFAGLAYDLQPDGAVFSPSVTITFHVPDAQWSQQYTIREFETKTGSWTDLPTTYSPESGTISASVSHFCSIALFSSAIPAKTPVTISKTMAAPPEVIPTPGTSSQFGVFYNMAVFITGVLIKNVYLVLIIIAIIAALYLRGRRRRLDKIRYDR